MKSIKKIMIIAAVAAVLASGTVVASAASGSLSVYLLEAGKSDKVLLHEYSLAEMESMSRGEVYYSSIDAMPATVLTVAYGVYMDELLADLKSYTSVNLSDFSRLTLRASDGWSRYFSGYKDLFATRYFFPGIYEEGMLDEDGKIVGYSGSSATVKPMLATYSSQARVPLNSSFGDVRIDYDDDYGRYRFCIGMSRNDLTSGDSTTRGFGHDIDAIEITIPASAVEKQAPKVGVTGLKLDKESANIILDRTIQLNATISPNNADNKKIIWTSDNTAVATVDGNGLVKGVGRGEAVITAKPDDNNSYSATCAITVAGNRDELPDGEIIDSSFADVAKHWAAASIDDMVELGVISGYGGNEFRPNNTITRAEFVSIIVRVLEKNGKVTPDVQNIFDDTENHWAKEAISTAVSAGITDGVGGGRFAPNASITREQMAVMIAKAFSISADSAVEFIDSDKISPWAVEAVQSVAGKGVITGYPDGSFGPGKNATRAEACVIIQRILMKNKLI